MNITNRPASGRPTLQAVQDVLVSIAREELLPRFEAGAGRRFKADGSLVTEADHALQRRLAEALQERWPGYAVLGEEMSPDEQKEALTHAGTALWCLDPLDGTSNFASGLPFFSVSLALIANEQTLLGWVYDPVRDECFTAETGKGAWLNGLPLTPQPRTTLAECLAVVDFKRLAAAMARRLAECPPYRSQRSFGSVALDWAWLAAGRYQIYLHGRQSPWDYAAGALILSEAGGCSKTLAGKPVKPCRLEPCSVVAASDAELNEQWMSWLKGA